VSGWDLNKGKTTQCRECRGSLPKNLQGKKFGEWSVLEEGEKKNGKTHWTCVCVCGKTANVCSASLTKGVSTKCLDCYRKLMPDHGYTCKKNRHPLYDLWMAMIARCENKKSISYKNYGGRGITVCERWHDLLLFSKDMGERPLGCSIDRINSDGNYEPGNCRWATNLEQGRNRGNNRILEYGGEKRCLSEWAEFFNIKHAALQKYLSRHSFEEAHAFYS